MRQISSKKHFPGFARSVCEHVGNPELSVFDLEPSSKTKVLKMIEITGFVSHPGNEGRVIFKSAQVVSPGHVFQTSHSFMGTVPVFLMAIHKETP